MPWVKRDGEGNIVEKSRLETAECTEWIEGNDPEELSFVRSSAEPDFPLNNYRDNRIIEYPSEGDQLDAISKALKYMLDNEVDIGPDGEALINQLTDIKDRFPKD
jgi:hypothetical protein